MDFIRLKRTRILNSPYRKRPGSRRILKLSRFSQALHRLVDFIDKLITDFLPLLE